MRDVAVSRANMARSKRLQRSRPRRADWAAGDRAKYLSYAEAWARIRLASRQGFFLEAVTVEESIISDRLTSYLVKSCDLDPASKGLGDLHNLVGIWAKHAGVQFHSEPVRLQEVEGLR